MLTLVYNTYIKKIVKKFNLEGIVIFLKIPLPLGKLIKNKGNIIK
jgi:uncharacterized membrane protein